MRTLTIDCAEIEDEKAFWKRYIDQVDTEGAGHFGHNLDAFWDACHGGPGWPGKAKLVLLNSAQLQHLIGGVFFRHLQEIARDQEFVPIEFR